MNRKPFKSGERQIIFNVFQECFAEFHAGKLLSDMEDVYGRCAKITGAAKLAEEAFGTVTPQEWKKCVHVIKIENEYFARGATLYNDIDRLVISVGDDDSSSESEESDSYSDSGGEQRAGVAEDISGVEYLNSDFLDSE